jgi:type III pantothenate kinase
VLLAIDIGNTNISCGVFRSGLLVKTFDLSSRQYGLTKFRQQIKALKITEIIICSVVPTLTFVLASDLGKLFCLRPYIIGRDVRVPIKNCYRHPAQVGQDRLVSAYAGSILYGAPLIIIDSGTAITYDVISKSKAYLGGLILPGLNISLAALSEKTALLPKIKIKPPKELIGQDTESSILSGTIYGAGLLMKTLVSEIKRKVGQQAQVVGTGGSIGLISRYANLKIKINNHLTLIGLNLIFEEMTRNKRPGLKS